MRWLDGITESLDYYLMYRGCIYDFHFLSPILHMTQSDVGSVPELERSPGEGNGNPLQYSCLDNPMNRRAWWDIAHAVTKNQHD